MGNKQQKADSNVNPNNQADDTGNDIQVRQKSDPPKKSAGCCGGCFGSKSQVNQRDKIKYQSSVKNKTSYAHDTRKSSILVKSLPNAKVDEKLFSDKDKALLEIKMKRAEPYQILKDSDYFDSEINDKSDLQRLKKVYDSCEIANYQTPQTEKLQTVQIKTYLFDRNLTKIEA